MRTVVQARIDEESRKAAEEIFRRMGMSISDGIRIFINQVINQNGLPFQPRLPTEDEFIAKAVAEAEEDIKAGRIRGPYTDVDEMMRDILKD